MISFEYTYVNDLAMRDINPTSLHTPFTRSRPALATSHSPFVHSSNCAGPTTQITEMSGLVDSMAAMAETATPLRFMWLNAQLQELSDVVGFPTDQLRCLLCLFAAYPLASVLTHLPGTSAKHWMNIFVGISMAQLIYGAGWLHSFGSASITYLLLKLAPTVYAPYIVFVFNMVRRETCSTPKGS